MLRHLSISLILSVIFINGLGLFSIRAQQENLPEIFVYVDRISDITGIKAEKFMRVLKEKLTKSNVKVEFTPVQSPFLSDYPDSIAYMSFDPVFDSQRIIQDYTVGISAFPSRLKEISPILKNDVGISVSVDSPIAADTIYAMILLSVNRCDLAIPIFQDISISNDDMTYEVNYNLATCYLLEGNYDKSIDLYKNLLYMDTPRFLGTNLAWLYVKTGYPDDAIDLMNNAVENAVAADEGPEDMLAARAQLYNLIFRYDDAITDLTAAIRILPTDPALYTLRGQTYLLLYEWDNVLADYNKALELDPTYSDAYFYRGVLKYSVLQTGQSLYADALADFQQYLELAPNGNHAADATRYANDIQTQLNALNS